MGANECGGCGVVHPGFGEVMTARATYKAGWQRWRGNALLALVALVSSCTSAPTVEPVHSGGPAPGAAAPPWPRPMLDCAPVGGASVDIRSISLHRSKLGESSRRSTDLTMFF